MAVVLMGVEWLFSPKAADAIATIILVGVIVALAWGVTVGAHRVGTIALAQFSQGSESR